MADRPGFGESASAVPRGRLQLEAGGSWTRVDQDTTAADGPQLLLRVGLVTGVELRLSAPDWSTLRVAGRPSSGWADTAAGLKGHLAAGSSDFAVRGTLYLPSGSAGFSSQRVDPELAIAWSRALSGNWSLGATLVRRWFRLGHDVLSSPSLSLGRALGSKAGTFLEYGASFAGGARPAHRLDHGYTWLIGSSTQLDASLGIALSAAAPDFFLGAGVCHRF